MKMKISLLFLAGGLFFISVAGIQQYKSSNIQTATLEKAKEVVKVKEAQILDGSAVTIKNEEVLGLLRLPTIKEELPIVKGVTEDALEKGVGHYDGTALPNQNDQIVLSGHRDTVFRRLGELKVGDELIVDMTYGSYSYIIDETFIVDADDRTVIRPTAPLEKLTLTTCYPFHFVGNAPQRYIINAIRK
ncbi:class D sortase [Bacillus sp. CGMCC 1.16607]|uniref:class D sortase n=1 Tax=Bacillus sp. CGMCC 1.16607 TaxID=3351842 RepID=UPI00362F3F35